MTLNLVQFLRDRFAEAAEDAARGYLRASEPKEYDGWDKTTTVGLPPIVARMVHADIESKQRIVAAYESAVTASGAAEVSTTVHHIMTGSVNSLRFALQVLALPYADHPGFKEEWRP